MPNKIISYKRYLNKSYLRTDESIDYLNRIIGDKEHFWSTTGRNGFRILFNLLGLKKGDHILVPAFSAHGIILPIRKMGLIPVFYKSEADLSPDVNDIEKKIQKNKSVIAVLVIHYFGFPQNLEPILKVTRRNKIVLIEDCAQAFFSKYSNKDDIGTRGDIVLYSLTKFLPVPDGSLFIVNNETLKLKINDIKYNFSFFNWLSINISLIQLLINKELSCSLYMPISLLLKMIYKILTPLHYILICSVKKPVNISKKTKRMLSYMDVNKMMKQRKKNLTYIYDRLNFSQVILYQEYFKGLCLTGIPFNLIDRKNILINLKAKGINPLVYNKFWWFAPSISNIEFKNQHDFYTTHILIPVNENLSIDQLDLIVSILNENKFKNHLLKKKI